MVPDATQAPTAPSGQESEDAVIAGYRECATEAMRWLTGLGYECGHPLLRSLAAHLTKRQAYLEKLDLEYFLADRSTQMEPKEESDEDEDEDSPSQVRRLVSLRTLLLEAAFRGCDLRYH